jgi:hypothetical protein
VSRIARDGSVADRSSTGGHRYQLTRTGRAVAVLFTKTYGRILGPGPAGLDPALASDLAQ